MASQRPLYISHLNVQNFRSLRLIDLDMPPEGLVLVGKNNHGKTNVFKALDAVLDFGRPSMPTEDFPSTSWRGDTVISVELSISAPELQNEFGRIFRKRPSQVTVSCTTSRKQKGKLDWSLDTNSGKPSQSTKDKLLPVLRDRIDFLFVPSQRDPSWDAQLESGSALRRLINLLFKDTRGRVGRPTTFEKRFADLGRSGNVVLEKAERRLAQIGQQYLGVQSLEIVPRPIRPAEVYDKFDFIVSDGISRASLRDKGTGWQSAFVIMLLQYIGELQLAQQCVIFGVEEPEAYLHAGAERKVWDAVTALCRQHQVIISTHSPVMVDAMTEDHWRRLRKLEKTKRDTIVLPEKALTQKVLSTYEQQCDTELSEILYADGVLFVEGPSDKAAWEFLLQEHLPKEASIKIVEMGGCGRAKLFVDFAERFACPWVMLLDYDAILKGPSGNDDFARLGKAESPRTGRRYVSKAAVDDSKKLASVTTTSYAMRKKVVDAINRRLSRYSIIVLPIDLEYELVTPSNEPEVVEVLKNTDVVTRGLPGCYQGTPPWADPQEDRMDQLRSAMGSKMLTGQGTHDHPLKARHVPRSILAGIHADFIPPGLVRFAKRISGMFADIMKRRDAL